mmetsp:Transcript_17476/g.41985  ORF Transcript_17476/g.41985 Transcript_17476/m.41985 type:complete len:97 (+) Transcript_17476:425-715(+)
MGVLIITSHHCTSRPTNRSSETSRRSLTQIPTVSQSVSLSRHAKTLRYLRASLFLCQRAHRDLTHGVFAEDNMGSIAMGRVTHEEPTPARRPASGD